MRRIGHNSKVGTVLLTTRRDFTPMDRSAFSQKLVNYGSTWRLDGRGYDGVNDNIVSAASSSLTIGKRNFTMSTRLKFTDTTLGSSFNIRVGGVFQFQGLFSINRDAANGFVGFETWSWATASSRTSSVVALNDNSFHIATAVYTVSDNIVRLYIDGLWVDAKSQSADNPDVSVPYEGTIGSNHSGIQWFTGTLDTSSARYYAEYAARIERSALIGGLRGRDGVRRTGG